MKPFLSRIAIALLVASIAGVSALAKTTSKPVEFLTNIKVNGTVVKKGVYDLKFDEETGELSIVKNDKVIARAPATSAKRDRKARSLEVRSAGSGDDVQLISIAFSGSDRDLVVNGAQATR